jgi:hypothetical protein
MLAFRFTMLFVLLEKSSIVGLKLFMFLAINEWENKSVRVD